MTYEMHSRAMSTLRHAITYLCGHHTLADATRFETLQILNQAEIDLMAEYKRMA